MDMTEMLDRLARRGLIAGTAVLVLGSVCGAAVAQEIAVLGNP